MPYNIFEERDDDPRRRDRYLRMLQDMSLAGAAGRPLSWQDRLRLKQANMFGELEPVERALPTSVHGVPTQGQQRTRGLVQFVEPYINRREFGSPEDIDALMERFKSGLGDERARGLLDVFKNVMMRRRLNEGE
jgi:hypothetical protein